MTVLDTNVLIRVLTNDDAEQSRKATAFIRSQERVYILKTVVLEIEWVLRSAYGFNREVIALGIRSLLGTANFQFEAEETVTQALEWFEQGMNFADAMHLASVHGESEFATFDVALRRTAQRLGIARVISI
jgi:predicted nucleic-acid-binding protein